MSVKIVINEDKEKLNEFIGTAIVWGAIAMLIGKLLGFKFNLKSDDQMREWGVQLGDAFKFSRRTMKNSGLSQDQQAYIDRLLTGAEHQINDAVQTEARNRRAGRRSITIDRDIQDICDRTVQDISKVVKDPRQAESYVTPLRKTFDNLHSALDSTRHEYVLNTLTSDARFRGLVTRGLPRGTRPEIVDAVIDNICRHIATRIA